MAIDRKSSGSKEPKFSFGVREIEEHEAGAARERAQLVLEEEARKPRREARGFDPYNNSGSFDRKKNWVRVGKR